MKVSDILRHVRAPQPASHGPELMPAPVVRFIDAPELQAFYLAITAAHQNNLDAHLTEVEINQLKAILAARWPQIKNTPDCYMQNPNSPVNIAYWKLARLLSEYLQEQLNLAAANAIAALNDTSDEEEEEISANQVAQNPGTPDCAWRLLIPTLNHSVTATEQMPIDRLEMGTFTLSDDQTTFLTLDDVYDSYISTSRLINPFYPSVLLSNDELARLCAIAKTIRGCHFEYGILQIAKEIITASAPLTETTLQALYKLSLALKGDQDMLSTIPVIPDIDLPESEKKLVAIILYFTAVFVPYISHLPEAEKTALMCVKTPNAEHETFGALYTALLHQPDSVCLSTAATTCSYLLKSVQQAHEIAEQLEPQADSDNSYESEAEDEGDSDDDYYSDPEARRSPSLRQ